jgi:glycosyltransferase involved in cell wall biosynthesis
VALVTTVSVLINNYNYARFVSDAIDSALEQSYRPLEVVVVDDGSTDDSRTVIERYGDRIVPVFKTNGGHGSTFNAGLTHARGEILGFLDADDRFAPDKVARVAEVFAQYPEAGWCFHRVRMVDDATGATLAHSRQRGSGAYDVRDELARGKLRFASPPTSGLSFRRSTLEAFFPIPEAAHTLISDRFVCYGALSLTPGHFLDEALTDLRVHGANDLTLQMGDDKIDLKAKKDLVNAEAVRERLPHLRPFAQRLFARGWSLYRRFGERDPEIDRRIERFLAGATATERLTLRLRSAGYDLARKRPRR